MSNADLSRRTSAKIKINGIDVTKDIKNHLMSVTFTDYEEDKADDIQIKLHDRDGIFLLNWLNQILASSIKGKLIQAEFIRENWEGNGGDKILDCGAFELDEITTSGPPSIVTIKGTSMPYSATVRQTLKTKAWEKYTLSRIAQEIASKNGLACLYDSATDPYYKRKEQIKTSDIAFLSGLCKSAGVSLKIANKIIVLFDQSKYEAKPPKLTIQHGAKGGYISYRLSTGSANTSFAACEVKYNDPQTGKLIETTVKTGDYKDGEKNQTLKINASVRSKGEAESLATQMLRLHNKFEKTGSFTFPGKPELHAGMTLMLEDWGFFEGKYISSRTQHQIISNSGYTSILDIRNVLKT